MISSAVEREAAEMTKRDVIVRALTALGVAGKVRIIEQDGRAVVYVDGRYFGIFDFGKNTFVD